MSEFLEKWTNSGEAKRQPVIVDSATLAAHRFFAVVDSIAKAAREENHSDLNWPAAYDGIEDDGDHTMRRAS